MAGLLDLFGTGPEDPRSQAMLALASGLLGAPKNSMQGLSQGLQGYSQVLEMDKRRKLEEEVRRAAIEETRAQAEQRRAMIEEQKARRAEEINAQNRRGNVLGSLDESAGPAMPLSVPRGLAGGLSLQEIGALMPARRKVARVEETMIDGRPARVMYDDEGNQMGAPLPQWKAPTQLDTGGSVGFMDPVTLSMLSQFKKSNSPDALLSAGTARRGQDMTDARAREANQLTADNAKWQFDATRGIQVNPQTGEARPVTMGGKPIEAKGTSADKAAQAAEMAYGTIDKMLKHPGTKTATGLSGQLDPRNYLWGTEAAGAQALIEQAQGQAFLQAYEALKGSGQITEVEGKKATEAIARLQRKQSDSDFQAAAKELQDIAKAAYKRATGKEMPGAGRSLQDLLKQYGE